MTSDGGTTALIIVALGELDRALAGAGVAATIKRPNKG
jgi:hypothetical protein